MSSKAPKVVWISADYFDEEGKLYESHQGRARVHPDPHPEKFCYPEGYFRFVFVPDEVHDSLAAAAPDLLALAHLIIKEWEAPTEGVQRGELIGRLSQYAKEARDAISKAEGRTA